MKLADLVFRSAPSKARNIANTSVVLLWLTAVIFLASRHVFWRDEVRALSIALHGSNPAEMLQGLHGEGHPAFWYLLLRFTAAFLPYALVLQGASLAVATAAMVLLAWKSPFGWFVLALFAVGMPALYEYSVMSRNYGISMFCMFGFAATYSRYRDHGLVLGALLFLLANCNAHSALLGAAFCLFWLTDLYRHKQVLKQGAIRNYWTNVALFAFGVFLCGLTIFPTFNDAARVESHGAVISQVARAIFLPATEYGNLMAARAFSPSLQALPLSIILLGSIAGLVERPAAMLAALTSCLGLSVFFALIYPGSYRHQALWLMFLLSMYWITGAPTAGITLGKTRTILRTSGWILLVVLLLLQAAQGARQAARLAADRAPESRSRDLARLISGDASLKNAIVVADPDYLVEALPAYMTNRVYRLRENQFGSIVRFTRKAQQELSLAEILAKARQLRDSEREPVLILLTERLDPTAPARRIPEGYSWTLTTSPQEARAFLSATRRMARFDVACCSDESFDVYLLDR